MHKFHLVPQGRRKRSEVRSLGAATNPVPDRHRGRKLKGATNSLLDFMSVRKLNCGNSTGGFFHILRGLSVTLLIGSGSFALALPASAQTCIWSSTVTVESSRAGGETLVGYNTHATPGGSSTSTTFTFREIEYTVTEVHNNADTGEVVFALSPLPSRGTAAGWTLQIGSLELSFSEGDRFVFNDPVRYFYKWTDTTNFGGSSPFTAGASLPMKIVVSSGEETTNVSIADVSVSESAGSATFTIELDPAISSDMFVNYATSTETGDTAISGADYTASSGIATITANSTSTTFTVPILQDKIDENSEVFSVTLSNPSQGGATLSDATAMGTITDDDDAPALVFSVDEASIAENGGTANITVSTGTGTTFATEQTIDLTLAGTATESDDYTIGSKTLALPAGSGAQASSVTVTVTGVDDLIHEADETILINASRSSVDIGSQHTLTITDDDGVPALVFSVDEASIAENGGTANITVSTGTGTTFATEQTIDLTLAGTATESDDYTIGSKTLALPAGSGAQASSVTVTVTGVDDLIHEADETILINASRSSVDIGSQHTLTITDDDGVPALVFSVDEASIAENGGTANITVSTGTGTTFATEQTIDLTLAGTATESDDYTIGSKTLALPAGSGAQASSVTVTVTGVDDIIQEADETILISASRSSVDIGSQHTLTITDDDGVPALVFSVDEASIAENGGTATITVSTGTGTTFATEQTIDLTLAGTATESDDYTIGSKTLALPAGSGAQASSVTVTVTGVDDIIQEADETILISASRSSVDIGSQHTLTITDDDGVPTLVFSVDEASIAENGGTATITVSTGSGPTFATEQTIDLTLAGTATESDDYTIGSKTLVLPALASAANTLVTALDDGLFEGNVDQTVLISAALDGTNIGAEQVIAIVDDEANSQVVLHLNPEEIKERARGSTLEVHVESRAEVTATVSPPAEGEFCVNITVSPLAPADEDDYELSSIPFPPQGMLPFAPGASESEGILFIYSTHNDEEEPHKTLTLSGRITGYDFEAWEETAAETTGILAPADRTLRITDDDEPPPPVSAVVTLVLTPDTIDENGGVSTVTASVSPASEESFSVTVSAIADAPAAAGDFEVSGTVLSFAANATQSTGEVTVTAIDNDEDAPDKTVTVSGSVSLTGVADPSHVTLTITDDDDEPPPPVSAVVTLVLTPDTIDENGGVSTVTASVSPASEESFSVTVSAVADAPAAAGDFEVSGTVLSFAANATQSTGEVTVTAIDNDEDAPDKTVTVSGSVSLTGVVEPSHGTLTITDDDDEPPPPVSAVVTLVLTPDTIDENGGVSVVTASVSPASEESFSVTVSAIADAPAAAGDFEVSGTVLSFAANATQSTGEVTVTAIDNDEDAPDKTVTVSGSVSLTGVVEPSHVTLTIIDDDEPPPPEPAVVTLVLTPDTIDENGGVSVVTASVSPASEEPFSVTVSAIADAPAAAGDFEVSGTVLSFAANATQSTGEVTVTAIDNDEDAPDKTVTVSGSVSLTGVVEPSHGTLTITDDDDEPPPPVSAVVTLVLTPDTIDENGGVSVVTASVSPASEESFSVTVSAIADAPAAAGDFEVSGTVLSFAANATQSTGEVTVTAIDNDEDAPDKTVTVSGSVSLTGVVEPSHVTLTIIDDDEPPPPEPAVVTLVLTPDTIDENGGVSTVTASVSPASEESFSVTVSAIADAPAAAGDFEVSGTVLSFAANATQSTGEVTVTAIDNDEDAPDKTVTVSGSVSLTGVVEPSHVTLTIIDDDEPPPPEPAVVTLVLRLRGERDGAEFCGQRDAEHGRSNGDRNRQRRGCAGQNRNGVGIGVADRCRGTITRHAHNHR